MEKEHSIIKDRKIKKESCVLSVVLRTLHICMTFPKAHRTYYHHHLTGHRMRFREGSN